MPDTTILLCPYNHSQQLEGRADETNTNPRDPIQEEENYYKKGVKRDKEGGTKTPQHTRGPKKGAPQAGLRISPLRWTQPVSTLRKESRNDRCPYSKT